MNNYPGTLLPGNLFNLPMAQDCLPLLVSGMGTEIDEYFVTAVQLWVSLSQLSLFSSTATGSEYKLYTIIAHNKFATINRNSSSGNAGFHHVLPMISRANVSRNIPSRARRPVTASQENDASCTHSQRRTCAWAAQTCARAAQTPTWNRSSPRSNLKVTLQK